MGYDFHTVGTHAGPTAPLGWIDAVGAQAAASGHPEKFILGLPNYGVTTSSFCSLAQCAGQCTGPIADSTNHMQSCPFGNFDAGRILNCDSANGQLFFDDTQSLEQKVQSAKNHGLGGITYWNVGNEPDGFFDMIQKYY
jgi:spore germination protein YaaH